LPEPTRVGAFSIDLATGTVIGPAAYMAERGSAKLREIEVGRCPVVNYAPTGTPIGQLVLVSLQTDYAAAWLGQQQLTRGLAR
jgi:hypothetical protein